MYILVDQTSKQAYISRVLKAFSPVTGCHVNTLRYWLKKPDIALKRGYLLMPAEYLKSKQGGNRK